MNSILDEIKNKYSIGDLHIIGDGQGDTENEITNDDYIDQSNVL